jgi:hypothetical protein
MNKNKNKKSGWIKLVQLAGLLTLLGGLGGPESAFSASIESREVDVNRKIEASIVELANQDRAEVGVGSLTRSEDLDRAARLKGEDMLENNYFSHDSPKGVEPWHWFGVVGYDYKYAGENLAMDFSQADAVNRAWMKSPTHRENILSPNYSEIGVAVLQGEVKGEQTRIAVQLFASPLGQRESYSELVTRELNEPVKIREVFIRPWEKGENDLLVFARASGGPTRMSLVFEKGEEGLTFSKIDQEKFVVLAPKKLFRSDWIAVRAQKGNHPDVLREIPPENFEELLEVDSGSNSSLKASLAVSSDSEGGQGIWKISFKDLILGVLFVVILILGAIIWRLENRERNFLKFLNK